MIDWRLWLALLLIVWLGGLWMLERWRTERLLRWLAREDLAAAPAVHGREAPQSAAATASCIQVYPKCPFSKFCFSRVDRCRKFRSSCNPDGDP